MSRGVKYYLLPVLLVIAINALCFFILKRFPDQGSIFSERLINLVYWKVMILCMVQAGVLLFSHYERLYPRFLIVFTGIYAFLFLILYGITVKAQFRTWELYKQFMGNARGLKGFDLMSCFIGDHTWFFIPALLQALMVILLRRQQKQAALNALDQS